MTPRRLAPRRLLLPALLGLLPTCGLTAQEPLVSDRPDVTESAVTVSAGRWQLEAGSTWAEDRGGDEELTVGEVLLRRGLSDRSELRLGVPSYLAADRAPDGFEDAALGLKLRLIQAETDRPRRPQTALIVETTLPTGSRGVREPHAQPTALLAVAWPLGAATELAANLGATYASVGGEQFGQAVASVALGRELADRLGGYVELFGSSREEPGGDASVLFDSGVTWSLGPDLQLDLRVGVGLDEATPDRFAGMGIVWRR